MENKETLPTLTNNDLFIIKQVLLESQNVKCSNEYLIYAITNINIIDARINVLNELKKENDTYKEFSEARTKLANDYCIKNPEGNIVVFEDEACTKLSTLNYGFPKPKDEHVKIYTESLEKLKVEYMVAIAEQDEKNVKFNETLKAPVEPVVNFKPIPFQLLPEFEQQKSFVFIKVLMPLIRYDI